MHAKNGSQCNSVCSPNPAQGFPKHSHQAESQRESPDLANMAQGTPSPIPASVIISERKERAEMKSSAPKTFFKQTKKFYYNMGIPLTIITSKQDTHCQ